MKLLVEDKDRLLEQKKVLAKNCSTACATICN